MQTYRLAILVVAYPGGDLVIGPPVVGHRHGSIGDEPGVGLCGDNVAQEDLFAIGVGRVDGREIPRAEEIAQLFGRGGVGGSEDAGAEFTAYRQTVLELDHVRIL